MNLNELDEIFEPEFSSKTLFGMPVCVVCLRAQIGTNPTCQIHSCGFVRCGECSADKTRSLSVCSVCNELFTAENLSEMNSENMRAVFGDPLVEHDLGSCYHNSDMRTFFRNSASPLPRQLRCADCVADRPDYLELSRKMVTISTFSRIAFVSLSGICGEFERTMARIGEWGLDFPLEEAFRELIGQEIEGLLRLNWSEFSQEHQRFFIWDFVGRMVIESRFLREVKAACHRLLKAGRVGFGHWRETMEELPRIHQGVDARDLDLESLDHQKFWRVTNFNRPNPIPMTFFHHPPHIPLKNPSPRRVRQTRAVLSARLTRTQHKISHLLADCPDFRKRHLPFLAYALPDMLRFIQTQIQQPKFSWLSQQQSSENRKQPRLFLLATDEGPVCYYESGDFKRRVGSGGFLDCLFIHINRGRVYQPTDEHFEAVPVPDTPMGSYFTIPFNKKRCLEVYKNQGDWVASSQFSFWPEDFELDPRHSLFDSRLLRVKAIYLLDFF